jgi:hypothetical protein
MTAPHRSETDLAEAQRIARLGSWEHDVGSGTLCWLDQVYRIFGFAPDDVVPTIKPLHVHPLARPVVRQAVHAALAEGKPDCVVVIAGSGTEALDQFDAQKPELVVLDISMPPTDGFEVCRRIRQTS